jgi:mRNA interferase RelE/StbE
VSAADGRDYELVLAPPARRAITDRLPEPAAAAVIDFITTAPVARPKQGGKPLRDDLIGVWSARRGTYRVLHRVLDGPREVVALRIEHRRDAYRRH